LGDNLYGNSLVCLNARNGELVWHFQAVHHDLWDYDLPAAPTLVDINVDGKPVKAVAQVSKQGFLYVFNRVTGEPIWPIEERPVPQTTVAGERSSPTQPIPTWPKPFELQGISEDDLIDFTPELRAEALEIIGQYDYGEIFTPPSLKGTINMPGFGGGAQWTGAAFDPHTSLYYIPSSTSPMVVTLHEQGFGALTAATVGRWIQWIWMRVTGDELAVPGLYRFRGEVLASIRGPQRLPVTKPPYTRVSAVDLNTGEYKWVVANGDGMRQRIIDSGLPDPGPVGGGAFTGPLLTKSLLFIGVNYSGKPLLRAFDKQTGEIVHETALPGSPTGTPMTYMVAGRQYISVAVGANRNAKLVTLSLQ
jgi:quinoprotein glucose dehydrogenase